MLDAMLRVSSLSAKSVIPVAPWLTLHDSAFARHKQRTSRHDREGDLHAPRDWRCRSCNGHVTEERERIAMAGDSLHRRVNPLGIEFEFGSFGNAPGVRTTGSETDEYTWFAGYRWRIALCGNCHAHLGWRFRSPDRQFFGLIVERMRLAAPDRLH
jgi:hypothetical protein